MPVRGLISLVEELKEVFEFLDNAQKKSTPKSCGQVWCIYLSFISTIGRHIFKKGRQSMPCWIFWKVARRK